MLADKILGLLGNSLSLIPDGNLRKRIEGDVRMAVIAAGGRWGPYGIVACSVGLTLVLYLNMTLWVGDVIGVHIPVKWDLLGILVVLAAAFFQQDVGSIFKWWSEWRKKQR